MTKSRFWLAVAGIAAAVLLIWGVPYLLFKPFDNAMHRSHGDRIEQIRFEVRTAQQEARTFIDDHAAVIDAQAAVNRAQQQRINEMNSHILGLQLEVRLLQDQLRRVEAAHPPVAEFIPPAAIPR